MKMTGKSIKRRKANRRSHVIGEDKERRPVRPEPREPHAIHDRAHGMFANAEVEVPAAVLTRFKTARVLDQRLGRRGKVSRASNQPRHVLRNGVQHF